MIETTAKKSVIPSIQVLPTGLKTSEILAHLRKENGYTLKEIGLISNTPIGTLKSWAIGKHCPSESKRLTLIQIFSSPELKPSKRARAKMHRAHGLTWDGSKRNWKLRLTLDMGAKLVGKRIQISMKTADRQIAIEKRDATVAAYEKVGLKVRISLQNRAHLRRV